MQYREKEGIPFLQSRLLLGAGFDKHAFFLKGISFGEDEINQGLALIHSVFDLEAVTYMKQEHKTEIGVADNTSRCIQGVDGLITEKADHALVVKHADCQAVLVVDPTKSVALALHVGWRGSVANFCEKAFLKLQQDYGTKPADCLVAISPSLGPERAEFKGHESYFPLSFLKAQVKENYFDFWQITALQLESLGVQPPNIDIAKVCTYADQKYCYSYRREGKASLKRHGSFIAL